jgi:hypothetical protein
MQPEKIRRYIADPRLQNLLRNKKSVFSFDPKEKHLENTKTNLEVEEGDAKNPLQSCGVDP